MEASRDAQIGRLSANGLTRDQLEEKVKLLKEQNYRIDQDTIAPLQEQARLAQVKVDLINEEIKAVTEVFKVANMTKTEWEEQKLRIEGAEAAAGKYTEALNISLNVVEKIKKTYDEILIAMQQMSGMTFTPLVDSGAPAPPVIPGVDPKPKPKPKPTPTPTGSTYKPFVGSGFYGSAVSGTNYSSGVMGSKGPTLAPISNKKTTSLKASGGKGYFMGGMISKFASGGFAIGTDTVPAMLTPGEFIVSKYGVDKFGVDNLKAINKGDNPSSSSVYNYNLSVNVKSDANPNEIARTVMMQIKQIDSQRIKGNRI
jgi:hypothetical protein